MIAESFALDFDATIKLFLKFLPRCGKPLLNVFENGLFHSLRFPAAMRGDATKATQPKWTAWMGATKGSCAILAASAVIFGQWRVSQSWSIQLASIHR